SHCALAVCRFVHHGDSSFSWRRRSAAATSYRSRSVARLRRHAVIRDELEGEADLLHLCFVRGLVEQECRATVLDVARQFRGDLVVAADEVRARCLFAASWREPIVVGEGLMPARIDLGGSTRNL